MMQVYHGHIGGAVPPPRVWIGRRSGHILFEIRLRTYPDKMIGSNGRPLNTYEVIGGNIRWPRFSSPVKLVSLDEARREMQAADQDAFYDEFAKQAGK